MRTSPTTNTSVGQPARNPPMPSSSGVPLPARGAYHLSGEARHDWEHSIAEMDRTRWSITFRSLRAIVLTRIVGLRA